MSSAGFSFLYELTDLAPFRVKTLSVALGINDSRHVVGCCGVPKFPYLWPVSMPLDYRLTQVRACQWIPGQPIVDLGTLGGPGSEAYGINSRGQVVGHSLNAPGRQHAFLLTPGEPMRDLGTLPVEPGQEDYSLAIGINDAGWVVGESRYKAVLWKPGEPIQALDPPGGRRDGESGFTEPLRPAEAPPSCACGINAHGSVVGEVYFSSEGLFHACLWPADPATMPGPPLDLGTQPPYWGHARSINSQGCVAGGCNEFTTATGMALFWSAAHVMHPLGTLGGWGAMAHGINDDQQIVGWSSIEKSERTHYLYHAFLAFQRRMVDLNKCVVSKSDFLLAGATGINNHGDICGYGITSNKKMHGFLLARYHITLSPQVTRTENCVQGVCSVTNGLPPSAGPQYAVHKLALYVRDQYADVGSKTVDGFADKHSGMWHGQTGTSGSSMTFTWECTSAAGGIRPGETQTGPAWSYNLLPNAPTGGVPGALEFEAFNLTGVLLDRGKLD